MKPTAQKELKNIETICYEIESIIENLETNDNLLRSDDRDTRLIGFRNYTKFQDQLKEKKIKISKAIDRYLRHEFKRER